MRLIDADAFVQFLKDTVIRQEYENLKIDGLLTVADVIGAIISDLDGTSLDGFKNAPTIKPVRKGYWMEDDNEMRVACSECGEPNDSMSDYCPNCGAKMEEGEQDG